MPLSAKQRLILDLLTKEYLSVKQIALRRKTTIQAVYKTIRILKKKGILNLPKLTGFKMGCTQPMPHQKAYKSFCQNLIRLHGQEFNIKILYKYPFYDQERTSNNLIFLDNNTIRLYPHSLEIYSGQSFYGSDAQEATSKSFEYWQTFFIQLANQLKIILVKDRKHNIKLVKSHYAETNNELARDSIEKQYLIKIIAKEDNKIWFEIDNSLNLHEAETIHPETSKQDMAEVIVPFFNDLRENHPLNLSQLTNVLNQSLKVNLETASGLNAVVKILNLIVREDEPPSDDQTKLDYFG